MQEIIKKINAALAQAVTSSKLTQEHLAFKYQMIEGDVLNGGKKLKEKLRNAGVTNKSELELMTQFLSKKINIESLTLRMLETYGKLDINSYLSDVMECGQVLSQTLQEEDQDAYNVVQREFAVVANGIKIGTTNIQQCVAVILKDKDSTALAHFDRYTTIESLQHNVQQTFAYGSSLEVKIYGGYSLDHQVKISSDNINSVLTTLNNLRDAGYDINVTSINTNISLQNENTPVLKAAFTDIIYDGQNIHGDIKPLLGNETYYLRDVIRIKSDTDRSYTYEASANIVRDAKLARFNTTHCTDAPKFITDNDTVNFSISQTQLKDLLFKFTDIPTSIDPKFNFCGIYNYMLSYYNVYHQAIKDTRAVVSDIYKHSSITRTNMDALKLKVVTQPPKDNLSAVERLNASRAQSKSPQPRTSRMGR